jgi:TonB family protein
MRRKPQCLNLNLNLNLSLTVALTLACAWHAAPASAQDIGQASFAELVDAVPLDRAPPQFPSGALQMGREGWVLVSYLVGEDGAVHDAMIEDSTGDRGFERAALNAIEGWRYEPATLNGTPVMQGETEVWIVFRLQGATGASQRFITAYQEAAQQLAANDLDAAAETLTEIDASIKANLYEDALYWWLRSIHLEAGTPESREDIKTSVRRAIGYEEHFLPPELLVTAIRRLYVMQFQDGELADAMETFEILETTEAAKTATSYAAVSQEIGGHVREIRALIAGSDVLASRAEIESNGYWFQRVLRRAFSVEDIDGELENLDLRCERRAAKYDSVTGGEVVAVPDGWDKCSVYVKGDPGATFVLNEYPDAP